MHRALREDERAGASSDHNFAAWSHRASIPCFTGEQQPWGHLLRAKESALMQRRPRTFTEITSE